MVGEDYQPITEADSIKRLEEHLTYRKAFCIKKLEHWAGEYLTHCKVMRTETTKTNFDAIDNLIISFDQELEKLLEKRDKSKGGGL